MVYFEEYCKLMSQLKIFIFLPLLWHLLNLRSRWDVGFLWNVRHLVRVSRLTFMNENVWITLLFKRFCLVAMFSEEKVRGGG
jgi:hypothetical protein